MAGTSTFPGETFSLRAAEPFPFAAFSQAVRDQVSAGARIAAYFGRPGADGGVDLVAVLASGSEGLLAVLSTRVTGSFGAITSVCPQAHLFEREIAEQCGVRPEGHPWPKPVRYQRRPGNDGAGAPVAAAVGEFFRVDGEEVHEVAVGPVHAGVIEPGHFRFSCHGENVIHLEIALGFQHRGVERALVGGPGARTIHLIETIAGDTSVAHAIAYCEALEALAACHVPVRGEALRGVALELERLANHVGDLGALAGDVGFLPTMSYCGRLRGDFLNATALICGSRFGRGLVRPGGVAFDVDAAMARDLRARITDAMKDVTEAAGLMWDSPSVQSRFENTGAISAETARSLGLVGVTARACGIERDVRLEFPSGIFRFAQLPVSTWHTGDVFARAWVRWMEIQRSAAFVIEQLDSLPAGAVRAEVGTAAPNSAVVTLVEGWRGEICHVAITDRDGQFATYKVVDPSFHNWAALAIAMRDQQISDFPLCNKSFNLSYCGHDL